MKAMKLYWWRWYFLPWWREFLDARPWRYPIVCPVCDGKAGSKIGCSSDMEPPEWCMYCDARGRVGPVAWLRVAWWDNLPVGVIEWWDKRRGER
jgi:hypothetical protein